MEYFALKIYSLPFVLLCSLTDLWVLQVSSFQAGVVMAVWGIENPQLLIFVRGRGSAGEQMLMGKLIYRRNCEKKDGSCWVPKMLTNPVFRQSNGMSQLPVMGCSQRCMELLVSPWLLSPVLWQTPRGHCLCQWLGQLRSKPSTTKRMKTTEWNITIIIVHWKGGISSQASHYF